jgi:hypothetical protein
VALSCGAHEKRLGELGSTPDHWTGNVKASRHAVLTVVIVALATACHSESFAGGLQGPVPAGITTGDGYGQTGPVNQLLPKPVTVVVSDQYGSPMPHVSVAWLVGTFGGSVDSATTVSNASGVASAQWTLGTVAQVDSLTATIPGGLAAVVIIATAVAGPIAAITKASGDVQRLAPGGFISQPLVVQLNDRYGNPVAGAVVTWGSNGGTLSAQTTTTGANGQASVTLTSAASAMNYSVTATAGAALSVTFTLTGS